ncbi:MAG: NAD-dependent epimerase/dehydratase family protein [Ignavibacteriaceae bacterium]
MRILITGATGFVGKNLVPKLINRKYEIFEVTIQPAISKELYGEKTLQYYYTYDKHDKFKNEVLEFNPSVIIHLASYLTASDETKNIKKLLDANIVFLNYLLDAVKNTNLEWFINTGSFAEYFKGDGVLDPAYLYTATKSASRIFVDYYSKVYNFKYFTIVPYTIYGGLDTQKKIIDLIYDALGSNEALDLSPGNQILDFIHLEDVTDFYIQVLENLSNIESGSNFQVGTGTGHNLVEIVRIIEEQTGKKANINWGGRPYRPRDTMFAVANISLQYHLFSWKPKILLVDGIRNYLKEKNK